MSDRPLIERAALRVEQALGIYFVTTFKARELLEFAYSDRLEAIRSARTETYELVGTQRKLEPARLRSVADYISRIDSAFPNAIILAANFRKDDGNIEDDPALRWSVREEAGHWTITVPTAAKLATVIDGQHRLFAYAEAIAPRLDDDLVCSVFIDLPKAIQAALFATINSTQKPVDRSLTYELFGYNVAEQPAEEWSPDKLAVFLARKLATDPDSALFNRVLVAPEHGVDLNEAGRAGWAVSTSAVVDGILKLFSSNPKRDANFLLSGRRRDRSSLRDAVRDQTPLRELYLVSNDQLLYVLVRNFLAACDQTLWRTAPPRSFITRTVGISALFWILRRHAAQLVQERDLTVARFARLLAPAAGIDYANDRFRVSSGGGESTIRRAIAEAIDGLAQPTT